MNLVEFIKLTGAIPNKGQTTSGITFETDIQPNGKLGFIATMWETKGTGYREHLIEYGTGQTADKAKENLKNKILSNHPQP